MEGRKHRGGGGDPRQATGEKWRGGGRDDRLEEEMQGSSGESGGDCSHQSQANKQEEAVRIQWPVTA